MWHEARKQERLIRGMIVDYRRRAERRKDFYEKIKAEPTQFLQLHGRPCKIHLDPAVAAAGEGPAIMMPWQGDSQNMIDRFDVRAHLDFMPEIKYPDIPPEDLSTEERQCNYERYRILAQNAFLGISEDKFLQQLAIEEQFGVTIEEKEMQKEKLNEKKGSGAAIGYNYNDPGAQPSSSNGPDVKKVEQKDSDDDSDLEIIDVDLSIDVNKMEPLQAHELNAVGPQFGMAGCDLFSFLTGDADDAEHQKQLLREEKEKAMFSGRKSRRERRAHRDKKLAARVVSPPSYAAPSTESASAPAPSRSPTRSPSPDAGDSIQFITSFGGDDDEVKPPLPPKSSYSEKLKQNLKKPELYSEMARKPRARSQSPQERHPRQIGPRRAESKSRSPSYSRSRSRSRSRLRSRSRAYSRSLSRSVTSRSRSRSYSTYRRTRSRSRSRSRSRTQRNRRSRSHSNHASSYAKRNDSRSFPYESSESHAGAGASSSKPPASRYYGRRAEDRSSSDDLSASDDDDDDKSTVGNKPNTNQNQFRLSGSSSKGPSREAISLKEKLKRKMQAQLARQLRADKRAEAERRDRESRRQARRDEEMRELAIKLRRKQREMRHQQNRRSSDEDSTKSRSGSSSRESPAPENPRASRSRSRTKSPAEKRIPVWETNRLSPPNYRNKYPESGENSQFQPRKRYNENLEDQTQPEDRKNYNNRYDRYPNRTNEGRGYDNYNRQDYSQGNERWEQRGFNRPPRRPYGNRGGYRGGYRPGPESSSWQQRSEQGSDHDRDDTYPKNKVKLVDY